MSEAQDDDRASGTGLASVVGSWRLLSVVLMSFASGLPLGLVWLAIPAWMAREGVDIKVIGLFTLAQAPWSFKLVWSPWMDRYTPPLFGRKRGWILIGQVALFALTLWLAGVSDRPDAVWVIGALTLAIAFASATQDIAIDAYAVEVLRRDEQGIASGSRTAFYRAAMLVAGGASITLAASTLVGLRQPDAGAPVPAVHGRDRARAGARRAAAARRAACARRCGGRSWASWASTARSRSWASWSSTS